MHTLNVSNATELAFQAVGTHSSAFTPKHRDRESHRGEGREGERSVIEVV